MERNITASLRDRSSITNEQTNDIQRETSKRHVDVECVKVKSIRVIPNESVSGTKDCSGKLFLASERAFWSSC